MLKTLYNKGDFAYGIKIPKRKRAMVTLNVAKSNTKKLILYFVYSLILFPNIHAQTTRRKERIKSGVNIISRIKTSWGIYMLTEGSVI